MSKNNLLIVILIFSLLLITTVYIILRNEPLSWLNLIFASLAIAGFIIYFYIKYSQKSENPKTTVIYKPKKLLAKLVFPDNKELKINEYEKIFGRDDFVGSMLIDNLLFLGKQHFKLTLLDDGFYIQDLDTKNGTTVNGKEIKGMGKIKLKDKDEITIGKVFKIKYLEDSV